MITLSVNGKPKQLEQKVMLNQALTGWGYKGRHFAVALNGEFIPRGRYNEVALRGGESLEILSPMQGG